MNHRLAFLVVAASLLAGTPSESDACSCALPPSACAATDRADAVFVGRVISASSPVQFHIERAVKGVTQGTVAVANNLGTCALTFVAGERYIVYAYRDKSTGALATHMCTRTRTLRDPHAHADLAYFELRSADRLPVGLLTGVVMDMTTNLDARQLSSRGLAGIRIRVEPTDGGRPLITSSRPDGSYQITGVAPGRFTVTADLPPEFEATRAVPGSMTTTASCTEVDIHGFVNGRIRGRLLDEQGRPARGIEVHAVEPRSARTVETFLPVLRAMTDEQGTFEFRRVGPGRYLIGVELQNPVPAGKLNRRRFFGETRDPAAATVVDLGMAEQRELPPFKLIALPSERSMTIVLRAPGPEVAAATQLFVTGAARKLLDHSSDALTLRLPFGAAYQVEAVAPAGYRVERRFVRIDRDDTDRTIEFRIERQ